MATVISSTISERYVIRIVLDTDFGNSEDMLDVSKYNITTNSGIIDFLPEVVWAEYITTATYDITLDLMWNSYVYTLEYLNDSVAFSCSTTCSVGDSDSGEYCVNIVSPNKGEIDVSVSNGLELTVSRAETILPDDLSSTLTLSINSVEVSNYSEDTNSYKRTISLDTTLYYDSNYKIEATAGDSSDTLYFWTESASYYISEPDELYFYEPTTQVIANNYPLGSKIRTDKYSVGQVFLNPIAKSFANLSLYINSLTTNLYPQLADTTLDGSMSVASIDNFSFDKRYLPEGEVRYLTPTVLVHDSIHRTEYELAEDNSLYKAISHLPTHFSSSFEHTAPLLTYSLESFAGATLYHDLESPYTIFFSVENWDSFMFKEYDSGLVYSTVLEVVGTTDRLIEESELIPLIGNGLYKTSKKYEQLKKITVHNPMNVNTDAVLKYATEPIVPNGEAYPVIRDLSHNYINTKTNKTTWWQIEDRESDSIGSMLNMKIIRANSEEDVIAGDIQLDTIVGYEMMDTNGTTPVDIYSIAPKTYSNLLYAIGTPKEDYTAASRLYIYSKNSQYPSNTALTILKDTTPNYQTELIVEDPNTGRDSNGERVVELYPYRQSEFSGIRRTRLKVYIPDDAVGSSYSSIYLDPDTGLEASETQAWRVNTYGGNLEWSHYSYSYTLDKPGHYIFELETTYHEGQTDIHQVVVANECKRALAAYKTSFLPANPLLIFNDANRHLNILCDDDKVYRITEHRNRHVIDFDKAEVYILSASVDSVDITYEYKGY